MKEKTGKNYLITAIVAAVIFIIIVVMEGNSMGLADHLTRILSDGFFIGGGLIILLGLVCVIINNGGIFPVGFLKRKFSRKVGNEKKQTYFEYVTEMQNKEQMAVKHFFVIGLPMVVISVLLALV